MRVIVVCGCRVCRNVERSTVRKGKAPTVLLLSLYTRTHSLIAPALSRSTPLPCSSPIRSCQIPRALPVLSSAGARPALLGLVHHETCMPRPMHMYRRGEAGDWGEMGSRRERGNEISPKAFMPGKKTSTGGRLGKNRNKLILPLLDRC